MTATQDAVLDAAAGLVKPGGRLIYVTCSVLGAENEDRIAAFLARRPDFALVPAPAAWTEVLATPCPVATDTLRLSPAATGTDGFFCAVLVRAI